MFEYIDIGPTPCEEDCAQVGDPDYQSKARKECAAFRNQIQRWAPPPPGASLVIRANRHDFGAYYEVAVRYDVADEAACEYAYMIEGEIPTHWDAQAKEDLK